MKKLCILMSLIFAVALVMVTAVACDPKDNTPDYTITVIGLDDKPSVGTQVQMCTVASDGGLGMCYTLDKKTDENGQVFVYIGEGKDVPEGTDHVEVHLQGLAPYYGWSESRMHKGESKTINIIENLLTPDGNGTAEYVDDKLDTKAESFDPYVMKYDTVKGGCAYTFKFTSAEQKIFIEYSTTLEYDYKVYTISGVELKLTELQGNIEKGITKDGDEKHTATGAELNYEFETVEEQGDGYVAYFELELVNADDVNKEIKLCFETVKG